jgi:hypothetical protein
VPVATGPNGAVVSAPQHVHYSFRGPELEEYSFYEYCALVTVVHKLKPSGEQALDADPPEDAAGADEPLARGWTGSLSECWLSFSRRW